MFIGEQPITISSSTRKWANDKTWKERKTVLNLVFEQHKGCEELKTMSIYLYIKWTADQSLTAPPCPAVGVHWRPANSSEAGAVRLADSSARRNSGYERLIKEAFPTWLQQKIDPGSQVWFRGDMVGTATTAETKVTKESNLKYIVVVLRGTEEWMKEFQKLELRNFHPRDEA